MSSTQDQQDTRTLEPVHDQDSFTLDSEGFTCEKVFDEPEVWRVCLLMGQTFLPSVNAFVVLDEGDALIVDCGTADDYNDTRLMRALVRLGVDPARATLFCTHAHNDHAGQASALAQAGVQVCAYEKTVDDMLYLPTGENLDAMVSRLMLEGVGREEAKDLASAIWAHNIDLAAQGVSCRPLAADDTLTCGRFTFELVPTPGHMPGQCVLWLAEKSLAFTGDVVLFACSSCISFWEGTADSLSQQLASLERLRDLGIEHPMLGHGVPEGELSERCEKNIAHHLRRAERALAAVAVHPGSTGLELVPHLGWRAPFDTWGQVPALTRWFLVSESIAHLDRLVALGQVTSEIDERGHHRYFSA